MASVAFVKGDGDNVKIRPNAKFNAGMYFSDGYRRIDFVLVYQKVVDIDGEAKKLKRNAFIRSLRNEGLEMEIQDENGHIYDKSFQMSEKDSVQIIENEACNCNLVFIKICAKWDTLCRYAEVMKIRKPMLNLGIEHDFNRKTFFQRLFSKFDFLEIFTINEAELKPITRGFTYPFSNSKLYLFDVPDDNTKFFTSSERSFIVHYILRRASYKRISVKDQADPTDIDFLEASIMNQNLDLMSLTKISENDFGSVVTDMEETLNEIPSNEMPLDASFVPKRGSDVSKTGMEFGIARLVNEGVFDSCYPLHEPKSGDIIEHATDEDVTDNLRMLLLKHWVSMGNIFRLQPLDHIKLYFGEKVAFYFAWLGYYTYWLLPISILGIIVTVISIYNAIGDSIVNEVCQGTNYTMCPLRCSYKGCRFWKLSDMCSRIKIIRFLDNGASVFLAVIMSIWASLFIEMWKRQQCRLAYRWNVHDIEYEDEIARPEFLALIDKNYKSKENKITGKPEPFIPFWRQKVPVIFLTYGTVLLSIVLALALLVGIILYKLVTMSLLRMIGSNTLSNMSNFISAATGSLISLIIIISLTLVYSQVAVWLTDLEHHRTQSQYDSSVTLKLYLLEFVNNYSSIFYIGFIQAYTQQIPDSHSTSMIKPRGCPGGCLVELCMQLTFIMIGKQIISAIKEYTLPKVCSSIKKYRFDKNARKVASKYNDAEMEMDAVIIDNAKVSNEDDEMSDRPKDPLLSRLCSDNVLTDAGPRPMFGEYLEMLIQFGFMTIFIPAFPLAPVLALINNIFEIRSDAMKFVKDLRRPVAQRVNNIGIWLSILTVVSRIAVKSNAILIAFGTTYIERFVYKYRYGNGDLAGFIPFSLSSMFSSSFNITSAGKGSQSQKYSTNETYCKYFGFRYPPDAKFHEPFSFSPQYWEILAFKVVFVYLFENFVLLVMTIISIVVPDIPDKLRLAMKRENSKTNDIILKAEKLRHITENASRIVAESFKKISPQKSHFGKTKLFKSIFSKQSSVKRSKSSESKDEAV